jgi:hypothetical protein
MIFMLITGGNGFPHGIYFASNKGRKFTYFMMICGTFAVHIQHAIFFAVVSDEH